MTFYERIRACLPNRGIIFYPTYDREVWAEFTIEGCDDVFHVVDMWNFGGVAFDAPDRYVLDRNVDPENPTKPEKVAPSLPELLHGI